MRTLLLLRHAKSSWKDTALDDHDRPLNVRGKRDAPRMGRLLHEKGILPDRIVSSSAKRARRTAEKVAEAAGFDGPLDVTDVLYLASPRDYFSVLRGVPLEDCTVMVVGHNPGMEELLSVLTGRQEPLSTAALVQVELSIDAWTDLSESTAGQLINLWRPRE